MKVDLGEKEAKKTVSNKEQWRGARRIGTPAHISLYVVFVCARLVYFKLLRASWLSARSPLIGCADKLTQMHVSSIFNKHVPLPYHWACNQYPRTLNKLWSIMAHVFSMCWAVCNVLIKQRGTVIQSWTGAGFTMIHRQVHRRSPSAPLERVPAVLDRLQQSCALH